MLNPIASSAKNDTKPRPQIGCKWTKSTWLASKLAAAKNKSIGDRNMTQSLGAIDVIRPHYRPLIDHVNDFIDLFTSGPDNLQNGVTRHWTFDGHVSFGHGCDLRYRSDVRQTWFNPMDSFQDRALVVEDIKSSQWQLVYERPSESDGGTLNPN